MPSGGQERFAVAEADSLNGRSVCGSRASSLVLAWAWALLVTGATLHAQAAAEPGSTTIGPRAGAGQRAVNLSVEGGSAPAGRANSASPAATATKGAAAPANHKRGRPPKEPLPSLPPGAARQPFDAAARRSIAGGATVEQLRAGSEDPELRALRAAEEVLFPKPLPGARSGWSWEFPSAAPSREPELLDSGLPPSASPPAPIAVEATADATWL
ncbi:MAG: hypothetical protein JW940_21810, partial [Polyangiaceae bacterium]|nr:hypothetical protein [Polyangiaceae bacterium]